MKLKSIRTKLLLVLAVLLFFILGTTDLVWFFTVRPMVMNRLQELQQQMGNRASDNVKDFLDAKVRVLIVRSQSAAFLTKDRELEIIELRTLFSNDQDIEKIAIINTDGFEELSISKDGQIQQDSLLDRRQSPSYVATTFRYGKEYISDVSFIDNEPILTVAVPIIIPESSHKLTDLTTGTSGIISRQNGTLGIIEATINLGNLFQEITALESKQSGYLYVVDRNGVVIAHKDKKFVNDTSHFQNVPPVNNFVSGTGLLGSGDAHEDQLFQYVNEYDEAVFGTFVPIPNTSWAVVIQQPNSTALADLAQVTSFALLLFVVGLAVTIPFAYLLAKRFTDPIHTLVDGAHILGTGKLDHVVELETQDELSELAGAFNLMAGKLHESRTKLEQDNDIIEAERNKLEVILSGISDAVIAVDAERKIILFNAIAEEITGYTAEQMLGKPIAELAEFYEKDFKLTVEDYCPLRFDGFEGTLLNKKRVRMRTETGKELFVNIVASQIKEAPTVGIGCILTLHNVTKEQQLEEMKVDFVSLAAHELRTPLTSIQGYAGLMVKKMQSLDTDMQLSLQNLLSNCDKLSNLIDNLLNASRVEQGRLTVQRKLIDIVPMVEEVVGSLAHQAFIKLQSLELEKNEKVPHILADMFLLREVVTNLITNAIHYTPEKGTIWVQISHLVENNKQFVAVAVKDTGAGIPKESLPHLFTKFYRVGRVLEMETKGSGLGLFLSKSIMELHKGRIDVQSELGKGSTFTIYLPVATEEDLAQFQTSKAVDQHMESQGVILNTRRQK